MVAASNQNKMSNDNINVAPNLYLQLGDDFQHVKMGLMDPFLRANGWRLGRRR